MPIMLIMIKTFIRCQKILSSVPSDEENHVIQNADRGLVILHDDITNL